MLTRTTAILAGTLILVSASAQAAQPDRHTPKMQHWRNSAAHAFGLATTRDAVSPPHVFSGGRDQGTDPDERVRMQLLRDPPFDS